jgi:hypothetical protein
VLSLTCEQASEHPKAENQPVKAFIYLINMYLPLLCNMLQGSRYFRNFVILNSKFAKLKRRQLVQIVKIANLGRRHQIPIYSSTFF